MEPGLYITATPIGNLKDITFRAIEVLKAADLIVCEDTRVTAKLLQHYGIAAKLMVYNDHSREQDRERIFNEIKNGKIVALVSDAGTPLISDPGYKLVAEARSRNIFVSTLPGASAITAALTIAGLPTDSFMFLGFAEVKDGARKKQFEKVKNVDTTLILFDRGSRVKDTLNIAGQVLGDRECAIVREISKLYEEAKTGKISELSEGIDVEVKGEVVLLISNKQQTAQLSDDELNEKLTRLLYDNSVKDASVIAAEIYGISRKDAYEKLLELKNIQRE